MRKMTLVPFDAPAAAAAAGPAYSQQSFNPYFRQTLDVFEPTVKAVKTLQDDIVSMLQDPTLSDFDKATFLTQMQSKMNTHINNYRNSLNPQSSLTSATTAPVGTAAPATTTTVPTSSSPTPTPTPLTVSGDTKTRILDTISKGNRAKASYVLDALETNPDFKINDKREIVIQDRVVPGSNIVDLLLYSTTNRKYPTTLQGVGEFTHQLRETNVPRSYLNARALSKSVTHPPALHSPLPSSFNVPQLHFDSTPPSSPPRLAPNWEDFPRLF